ncbi:MAG: hypothetical protein K1X94_10400 [Sandaracinaceae bacterium]|nr:hypothetical protein [Sandaracinaceae bacterium]
MYDGSRVTDAVDYWTHRENLKKAVAVVRGRAPERFRWRRAVGGVSLSIGKLRGRDRLLVEEPVRELVLDLDDGLLRREVVIDARRAGVDFDRGEVLRRYTLRDLQGLAAETGTDLSRLGKHVRLPAGAEHAIDTAGAIVIARALADHFRSRAQHLLLQVPDPDGPEPLMLHHKIMLERADRDRAESQRWLGLAKRLLG